MLTAGSESVLSTAAWHVAELGLVELLPALTGLDLGRQRHAAPVVQDAIHRLEGATQRARA